MAAGLGSIHGQGSRFPEKNNQSINRNQSLTVAKTVIGQVMKLNPKRDYYRDVKLGTTFNDF